MPCPHNEITIVQRSQRQSAVAAAAYQSGEKLFCEYDQQVKHYPEKRGIVHNEILLPVHMPPQKCNLTADDGASPPPEWCTPSAKMVHGGRERGAPDRHAGDHSGMPLRFRMDSPSIWMV